MKTASDRPVALVTGAGGGLGGAIAHALAAGHDLVLNDLSADTLEPLAADLRATGARVAVAAQDIARVEELPTFVQHVQDAFGRLDVLVNNAGVSVMSRGDILDVTPESFDRCIAVNLRGQFFLTQAVARAMIAAPAPDPERRRAIVTVTSVAVDTIGTVLAEYSISKAGLAHAVKDFAVRLVTEGIDCYEVRPGMMKTAMTASSLEKYSAMIEGGHVPARRWGEVEDIAQSIATLASGGLRYAVGQTLNIDGGFSLKTY